MRPWLARSLFAVSLAVTGNAHATVLSEDEFEGSSTALGAVWRSFGFTLAGPVLAPPYAPLDLSPTVVGIFDTRLYFERKTSRYQFVIHPQLTLRGFSHEVGGIASLGRGPSPPRWLPLSYDFVDESTVKLRGSIDRLYLSYTLGPATVIVGRQAVTFGRGKLWRTSDVVSTFSLTEVDTEYKPGSDALRIDINFGESRDLTIVAAAGEIESDEHDAEVTVQGSTALARYQHGGAIGEVGAMAGMVRGDVFVSLDGTLDLGSFDIYGEASVTHPTSNSLSTPTAADSPIVKGLLGATFKPGAKVTFTPEFMYSGFGAWRSEDYLKALSSERVAIGEQTTIGRLYAGLATQVELDPLWNLVTAQIVNLHDPSGLFSLALQHNLANNASVLVGAYAPMGKLPESGFIPLPQSEFGSYPYFVFTELKGVL